MGTSVCLRYRQMQDQLTNLIAVRRHSKNMSVSFESSSRRERLLSMKLSRSTQIYMLHTNRVKTSSRLCSKGEVTTMLKHLSKWRTSRPEMQLGNRKSCKTELSERSQWVISMKLTHNLCQHNEWRWIMSTCLYSQSVSRRLQTQPTRLSFLLGLIPDLISLVHKSSHPS